MTFKGKSININDERKLRIEIGEKIKLLYGDVKAPRKSEGQPYFLKLKTLEEVETDFKYAYVTNEDNLTEKQLDMLDKLTGNQRTVFNAIKKGVSSINKLNAKFPSINCYDVVKELEQLNLIKNTYNLTL